MYISTAQVVDEFDNLGVSSEALNILFDVDASALISIDKIEDFVEQGVDVRFHRRNLISSTRSTITLGAQKSLDLETKLVLGESTTAILIEGVE